MSSQTSGSKRSDQTKEKTAHIKEHLQGTRANMETAQEIIVRTSDRRKRKVYEESNSRREEAVDGMLAELADIHSPKKHTRDQSKRD